MAEEGQRYTKQLIGKTVVTKTGKKFGEVQNLTFEIRTGELIHIMLRNTTSYCEGLELEKDAKGVPLIPFSAVVAIGDYLVVAEEDII